MAESTTHPSTTVGLSRARIDRLLRAVLVLSFTALMAVSGQEFFKFYLPGNPYVPVTFQTAMVTLAGLTLGARMGSISVLLFLTLGFVGLPVFAGAREGLAVLTGATGGYLVGFLLVQPVIDRVVRRPDGTDRGWPGVVCGVLAAHAVIFAVGVPWLMATQSLGLGAGLSKGLLPFLPGAVLKAALAISLGTAIVPWRCRRGW